jgi:hypothetical protein
MPPMRSSLKCARSSTGSEEWKAHVAVRADADFCRARPFLGITVKSYAKTFPRPRSMTSPLG